VTEDNSKDLKVAVGVERSLQGSRRRNAVPLPTKLVAAQHFGTA